MKPILVTLIFSFSIVASLFAADVTASRVYTTSYSDSLPYQIFDGKPWKADPAVEYVILDVIFDAPVKVDSVELDATGLKESFQVFVNVNESVFSVVPSKVGKTTISVRGMSASTIAFNFGKNRGFTIKGIKYLDSHGDPIDLTVAKVVAGSASASSTLSPARSYDIRGLFDSRPEYGWSSDAKNKNVVLNFAFAKKQKVTALSVWNGYQRSKVHFSANSRAKTVKFEGDGGYSDVLRLDDEEGEQKLTLPKPFEGTNLKMTVIDSYPGSSYVDLVISELRFWDGIRPFLVDPITLPRANSAYNLGEFEKANLRDIVGSEINCDRENYSGHFKIRFRADGSMYGESYSYGKEGSFTFLGNYEVKKASDEGIDLRLFGYIVKETKILVEDDSGGGDCGGGGGSYWTKNGEERQIFTEFLSISRSGGTVSVRDTGKVKNFQLDSADFKLGE